MPRVAVAPTSALAADAASEVAERGGNAVDCALAAALLTMNTQPGVCSMSGSTFVTVWKSGQDAVTIDGNVAIPGKGLEDGDINPDAAVSVRMEYGGGLTTITGCGSVAVPGTIAAVELASRRFGAVPFAELWKPSIRAARDGFPLPENCHYYLQSVGIPIFSRSETGHRALYENGMLRPVGSRIYVDGLADSLEAIAREGGDTFYRGDLAQRIVDHVRAAGGPLSMNDMLAYEAIERPSLMSKAAGWDVACNPPPAVGGTVLAAMINAFGDEPLDGWDSAQIDRLVETQRRVLYYRRLHLDDADDRLQAALKLLEKSRSLLENWTSAATVHTSAVDDQGTGCSITASAGYGAGEIPEGTGLWLNNGLGELELNRRGLDAGPPGERLPSNMAPTVARRGDKVMSMGTPGADRITTALHQFIVHTFQRGLTLERAVCEPRLHVDMLEETDRLMLEPGLVSSSTLPQTRFETQNMYFGGVAAASWSADEGFHAASDPRRKGAVLLPPT